MRKYVRHLLLLAFLATPTVAERPKTSREPAVPPKVEISFPEESGIQRNIERYARDLENRFWKDNAQATKDGRNYDGWELSVTSEVTFRGPFICWVVKGDEKRSSSLSKPYLDVLYFTRRGRTLRRSDLITPDGYELLSKLCREKLVAEGRYASDDTRMLQGTEPNIDNFEFLVASEGGVEIVFEPGQLSELSPPNRGSQNSSVGQMSSLNLTWAEANPAFVEKYRYNP